MPRTPSPRIFTTCIALAALWLTAGCSRNPKAIEAEASPLEVVVESEIPRNETEAERIERYQPDVRMSARFDGEWIHLSIRNGSNQVLEIGPANFGLIVDGEVIRAQPGVVIPQFPIVDLAPGELASGSLKFLNRGDLTGKYAVFYHPATRPSRVEITR